MTAGSRLRGQAGFSLAEILVASTLALIALAAFASLNRFQLRALRKQATQIDLQTTARSVVDLFAREVRRAGMNPGCAIPDLIGINSATTYSLRVRSDLNGDGLISGSNEDVTYRYNFSGNSIERVDQTGTTDTLVSGVLLSGSVLRYFDGAGNELAVGGTGSLGLSQRAAVRRVRMVLALTAAEAYAAGSVPLRARVTTDVDLRNRYFVNTTACPGS